MVVLTIHRIAPPPWALASQEEVWEGGEIARAAFRPLLPAVYDLIHQAIEQYVNGDRTYPEDDEEDLDFPARARMTGDYYLEAPVYSVCTHGDHQSYSITVQANLIERKLVESWPDGDYLGLDVNIVFDETHPLQISGVHSKVL